MKVIVKSKVHYERSLVMNIRRRTFEILRHKRANGHAHGIKDFNLFFNVVTQFAWEIGPICANPFHYS